ncbi:endothelin-converting enzyme 2-like isoform X2 [Dermacentor albipictus]|uniref:endothelin-converting enzyme 2-like isoform X2 n=1 Tax=Dermacentor albipictus TaxID=60249 RepID=UPI0038FD273D
MDEKQAKSPQGTTPRHMSRTFSKQKLAEERTSRRDLTGSKKRRPHSKDTIRALQETTDVEAAPSYVTNIKAANAKSMVNEGIELEKAHSPSSDDRTTRQDQRTHKGRRSHTKELAKGAQDTIHNDIAQQRATYARAQDAKSPENGGSDHVQEAAGGETRPAQPTYAQSGKPKPPPSAGIDLSKLCSEDANAQIQLKASAVKAESATNSTIACEEGPSVRAAVSIPTAVDTSNQTRSASTLLRWSRHAKTRPLVEVGMLLVTLSGLILIVFLLYIHDAPTTMVCHNDVCEHYNQLLRESLGSAEDACHDFHQFVCSRWEAAHERSLQHYVHKRFFEKVYAEALTTTVPRTGQTAAQKAVMFYRSCFRVSNAEIDHLETVKELLLDAGVTWPELSNSPNLLRTLFLMTAAWNWASPLQFLVHREGRLEVKPDALYRDVLAKRNDMLKAVAQRSYYADYYDRMVQAFARSGGQELPYAEMLTLESSAISQLFPFYAPVNSKSLDNASLDDIVALAGNVFPNHVWQQELRMLGNTTAMSVYNAEYTFRIHNAAFFAAFFEFTKKEGEERTAYYVGWCVVQVASQLANRDLVRFSYQSVKEVAPGHAKLCSTLAHNYYGLAFYARHMKQQHTDGVIKGVSAMMHNIRASIRANINDTLGRPLLPAVPMLSADSHPDDALRILKELEDRTLNAAYSQFPDMSENVWENIAAATSATRRSDMEIMMKGNLGSDEVPRVIYYFNDKAGFEFLPMAFEAPVYSTQALDATNYGVLGSEIAAAFVDFLFAALLGADNETRADFEAKTLCFVESLPPNLTDATNARALLKRAVSLRIVYSAFHAPIDRQGTEMRLVGHLDITERQMLFIFWCLYQCSTPDAQYKCNVPVKTFRQFGAAFGCLRGSEMYSGQDCPVLV